mmetsp:Transcript_87505/g.136980  ORF Transcript_87505/g.136980 Transcript_87505/m.136980 type:complete len:268 (+) Transcript_87505:41-844(+)
MLDSMKWLRIAGVALAFPRTTGEETLATIVQVNWPVPAVPLDWDRGCPEKYIVAKDGMIRCLRESFAKANTTAGIESFKYRSLVCMCHTTFETQTSGCKDDGAIGKLLTSFDASSPTHCFCPGSTCNSSGMPVDFSRQPVAPWDQRISLVWFFDFSPGQPLLQILKAFVIATFACWCTCCLASTFRSLRRRKGQGYSEFEAEDENEDGSEEDETGTVGTSNSRLDESKEGSRSASEEDEDVETGSSSRAEGDNGSASGNVWYGPSSF